MTLIEKSHLNKMQWNLFIRNIILLCIYFELYDADLITFIPTSYDWTDHINSSY